MRAGVFHISTDFSTVFFHPDPVIFEFFAQSSPVFPFYFGIGMIIFSSAYASCLTLHLDYYNNIYFIVNNYISKKI